MFGDLLIMLLIVWLALPLGLIPAVIVLAVKNSKLRKMLSGEAVPYGLSENIPVKERKPLSFSVLLVVGVLFVIISGIVFATSGWNYMSGTVKTVMILSMSAVFFAACAVSEKKFHLDRTGFAFYLLGGIFLPVSVVGIAYFRLLGPWFMFSPSSAHYVFLTMMAVTLPVLIFAQYHYRGSAVVRYIFSTAFAVEYTGFSLAFTESIYGQDFEDVTLMAVLLGIGYLVFAAVPALRCVTAQFIFTASLLYCSAGLVRGSAAAAVCGLACTVISLMINRKAYSTLSIISFPVMTAALVNVLTAEIKDEQGYREDMAFIGVTMAVLAVLTFVFSASFLRNIRLPEVLRRGDKSEQTGIDSVKLKWLERACGTAITVFFFAGWIELDYDYGETEYLVFGFITAAYFALKAFEHHIRDTGRETDRNFALSLIGVTAAFTCFRFEAPEIIEAEFYCASSLLATIPLIFIWKNRRNITGWIVYIHTAVVLGILMLHAWDEGELINAVILIGVCTLMAVFSFIRRAKKWFIISAIASVLVALQLTGELFMISWWVYLLAVGLILIIYAAVNEYYRQKGEENPLKSGFREFADKVWK
ncbi:hypothetical protein [Ruminococcus sp. HUN007]|uniref:hypothetical protein n=1 Tax=Ruminococcus sp. HUN007 TaxID=1514668 RepID=UPI0005D17AB5|nr:hypothetical protein [Ruminococcus sp. HUN007]